MLKGTPNRFPDLIPTGRIWPSGDFGFGYRKTEPDSRVAMDTMESWHRSGALAPLEPGAVGRYGIPLTGEELGREPLNLTSPSNSHKVPAARSKRGLKGLTGHGKKMVKSALCLLERPGRYRLTFCTITLPTLPPDLRKKAARQWPEFVRQSLQWLDRRIKWQGLPRVVVSVSEIQPLRLLTGGEGYLHAHQVWPNVRARSGNWAIDVKEYRAWCNKFWSRRGLCPEGSWVNVNVQKVKKSAVGYLSKYMSKGGYVLKEFREDNGSDAVPSTWWNMTKAARDSVKANLLEGDAVGRLVESVINYTFDCDDFSAFIYLRHADISLDGRLVTVGWYGALTNDARQQFTSMLTQ